MSHAELCPAGGCPARAGTAAAGGLNRACFHRTERNQIVSGRNPKKTTRADSSSGRRLTTGPEVKSTWGSIRKGLMTDSAVAVIVVTAAIRLRWGKLSASVRHSSAALARERRDRPSDSLHSRDDRSRVVLSALSWRRARTVTSAR